MEIGRMNKRITFMRYTDELDEYNQNTQKLEEVKTVWASVEPLNGKQFVSAERFQNELTYNIYTRYIKDISPDMVINFMGRTFKIETVINYREENKQLNFVCTERVGENEILP